MAGSPDVPHDLAMSQTDPTGRSPARHALAGAVGALAAIGATELAAGVVPGMPSLVASVGAAVIDLQPPGAKDAVVALFGTNDKLALEVFIVLVALAVGAALGVLAERAPAVLPAGFAAFGLLAFGATLLDPQASPALAAVAAAVAVVVGLGITSWLRLGSLRGASGGRAGGSTGSSQMPDWSRRGFLLRAGGLAATATLGAVGGRALLEARIQRPTVAAAAIPGAVGSARLPAGAELDVPGITPLVVPNDRFYRIDTALLVPSVDLDSWRLRVRGMVDRDLALSFEELVALPLVEQYVTIACVSNEVGGSLVGNALWTGARLRDVLDLAGVQAGASQLVGRSLDGWTAGMPTAWVMDPSREPLVAVRMNGEPLPVAHGFPARLIVPGLYGYVSATKWLSELELTTWEAFDAYWVPLGWAKEGPILTQSRIDVPRDGAQAPAGTVVVAGVAWAPDRGVSAVEVSVDDGTWAPAQLSNPISGATWVQWRYDWDAAPGRHTLAVRATDGTGEVQTAEVTRPAPDGARGHHRVAVEVG